MPRDGMPPMVAEATGRPTMGETVARLATEIGVLDPGAAAALRRGPHFEGPVRVLDIPSRRFYATTGFPLKAPA